MRRLDWKFATLWSTLLLTTSLAIADPSCECGYTPRGVGPQGEWLGCAYVEPCDLWINQRTMELEPRPRSQPLTDDDAVRYLPPWPAAIGLYHIYRAQGLSVEESMVRVLQLTINADQPRTPEGR